ncbi:FtsX-like permease family protein [Rhodanobacter glycinis]|uniref:FtsX-like permease family protein n=1 Tax=Rhodanobacter glycinis TaxID=582702 RepID=A0A5B9E4D7_9GAMM|nr:ABC transporter permease [Rhodanobacter glycinis]QEE25925.1 FtsX-like permease family protein [Rhodanobacter glycinis]
MTIWLTEIWRAWRASLRRPGFLLLASGVLALGIGASVAVFALINSTLMQPLPVPQPSRLVVVGHMYDGQVSMTSQWQYQHLAPLEGVASFGLYLSDARVNVTDAAQPEQVPAIYADRGVLPTLGLHPAEGRNFTANEDRPGGAPVVLLGYGFWRRRYAANPGVIGRSLSIEGVAHTIVGVLPPAFTTVEGPAAVVLPLALPVASQEDSTNYYAIARLSAGASVAGISTRINARLHAMYRMRGDTDQQHKRFGVENFAAWKLRGAHSMLVLFLACGFFVLLIALVNLTNLMLLRALSRQHDVAVRNALGASRVRLMLPAFGEGLLVGVGGALVGMGLAAAGLALLQGFIPAAWLSGSHVGIGAVAWVLAFAIGLFGALLSAGLAVWRSRRAVTVDELREGGRSGMGTRSSLLGRLLVVVQVTLATILLCAAGVFMRALYNASQQPLHFTGNNILVFDLAPVSESYPDASSITAMSQRLIRRLDAIPGVTHAAAMTNLPTAVGTFGQFNTNIHLPGGWVNVQDHAVSPGFFKVFSLPVHAGRTFTRADRRGGERVAVISRNLADQIDSGRAIGKVLQLGSGSDTERLRVVGVVANTYQMGPLQPQQMVMYQPFDQWTAFNFFRKFEPLRFALRGHGNPADWRTSVREAVAEVAPGQPISSLRSMHSVVRATTRDARLSLWLISLFSALALALAATGMYAVMAVAVTAREREFGVRMALGAASTRLLWLVMRAGLMQIVLGLAIGVTVALSLSRLWSAVLMALLGNGSTLDSITVVVVCAVLAATGLLACLLPAMRAARVAPMHALRGE